MAAKLPAKLPANLSKPRDRELADLPVGETMYVLGASMGVNGSGECYLSATSTGVKRGYGSIRVDRRVDGFHVTVVAEGMKWEPDSVGTKSIPVLSVSEDYDPELDDPMESLLKKYGIK